MLILTRKTDESINIGDDIRVVILSVGRGQVKIGFEAPKNLSIHRSEIYQRIQQDKEKNND